MGYNPQNSGCCRSRVQESVLRPVSLNIFADDLVEFALSMFAFNTKLWGRHQTTCLRALCHWAKSTNSTKANAKSCTWEGIVKS